MTRKFLYISLLLIGVAQAQQDPQYSQYMFNQVVINPAYAGSKINWNATAIVRNQWVGIKGAPKTVSLSLNGPIKVKNLGVGGHVVGETIGPKSWTAMYSDISYKIRLGGGHLAFGLSAGMVSYKYNFSALDYADPTEMPSDLNELNKNKTSFDASFGLYYYNKSTYIGLSSSHINQPQLYNIASSDTTGTGSALIFNLTKHNFLTFGHGFIINDNLVFSPSLMIKTANKGIGRSMDLNLNFLINKKLWAGISMRSSKTYVLLAQYTLNNKFKIGYSYDANFSLLSRNRGSHEIMLGYVFLKQGSSIISPRFL